MKETILTAQPREAKGSAAARRLRRTGFFPAVVYGEGRPGLDIQLNEHDFVMMLRKHRSENMIVDLTVAGQPRPVKVMLKAMQHHPVTGRVIHVDFYEISMTRKIEIEVPVKVTGLATGVANEGGILEHVLRTLRGQCLPGDLLEEVAPWASASGARITVTADLSAVAGADAVYTDVWVSMGEPAEVWAERIKELSGYQVNAKLFEMTGNPGCVFLHCLPAVKGEEVTEEIIEGPASRVWDQAENRKHTIKAIMLATI